MSNEIEIGEYGRTNTGKIFIFAWITNSDGEKYKNKVILGDGKSFSFNTFYYFEEDEKIVKHSKNIIDLIEEGDFVNGKLIHKTDIEEDIKILKDLKDKKIHFNVSYFTTGTVQLDEKERQAIENILADRERLEKENEQLRINGINSLCEECSELAKAANWTKEDTNRVITECREMEVKANKYDSLVEKIKEKIKCLNKQEKEELKGTKGQDRYYIKQKYMYKRNTLQELLDTEKR